MMGSSGSHSSPLMDALETLADPDKFKSKIAQLKHYTSLHDEAFRNAEKEKAEAKTLLEHLKQDKNDNDLALRKIASNSQDLRTREAELSAGQVMLQKEKEAHVLAVQRHEADKALHAESVRQLEAKHQHADRRHDELDRRETHVLVREKAANERDNRHRAFVESIKV